jgi:spore maturation protein CgeB
MKILYGGVTTFGSTSEHRLRAFQRCARQVVGFSFSDRLESSIPLMRRMSERLLVSPGVSRLNADLIEVVARERPDMVWLDKPTMVHPRTIETLRAGGRQVVAYMPDDPYGPRENDIWRHFTPALDLYSAHAVPRDVTKQDFEARGASKVIVLPFGHEPTIHFPPSQLGITPRKEFDVSFVGSPQDDRLPWITDLARRLKGHSFGVFGPGWGPHANALRRLGVECRPPAWNDAYTDVIWRSRLSLSFINRSNRDEMSRGAIETSAAGSVALMEPSAIHDRTFADGRSAVFFSDPNALPDIIERSLADPNALSQIAAAAPEAVRRAGLSNDNIARSALLRLGVAEDVLYPVSARDAAAA